jgi:hypothetical protein
VMDDSDPRRPHPVVVFSSFKTQLAVRSSGFGLIQVPAPHYHHFVRSSYLR